MFSATRFRPHFTWRICLQDHIYHENDTTYYIYLVFLFSFRNATERKKEYFYSGYKYPDLLSRTSLLLCPTILTPLRFGGNCPSISASALTRANIGAGIGIDAFFRELSTCNFLAKSLAYMQKASKTSH